MAELIEGILPLWKEKGMTSFDCVSKVRHLLGIRKVGHSGTLDPEVDGVLPIGVGKGTKVLEYMLEADKTYSGELCLGYSTSTEDASGEKIKEKNVDENMTVEMIDNVLKEFEGKIEQTPPMFSAVKVKGKRLYEYAYEGIEVDRPSRKIEIHKIHRTSDLFFNSEENTARFSFTVTASKGTYIRTLAVDIGKKLSYPAHMSKLTRIQSGRIKKEITVTLKDLKEAVKKQKESNLLLPIKYALDTLLDYPITKELWLQVKNGRVFPEDKMDVKEYPVLFTYKEKAIAIYDYHPTKAGIIKPVKVLRTEL